LIIRGGSRELIEVISIILVIDSIELEAGLRGEPGTGLRVIGENRVLGNPERVRLLLRIFLFIISNTSRGQLAVTEGR
jgi:hypothetical protein